MSTENATTPLAAAAPPTLTLRKRLELIPIGERGLAPTNIDEVFRLAQAISISKLCPPGFSETDCFVLIATGLEIGLAPFTAIQNMYIVNNRANIFGDIALGLIRTKGVLEDYKQEYFGTAFEDDYGCRVTSKRKGMSEPIVTEYKVSDAKKAGLWNKSSPWATDPKRMLLFRARGFNLRDNFGDILKGCGVDTEDSEILPGFDHAKAAEGRIVQPSFDGEQKLAEPPTEEKKTESPPAAPSEEPVKRGPGRPKKDDILKRFPPVPPKETISKSVEAPEPVKESPPIEPVTPELTGPAAEVMRRLTADKLDLVEFIKIMERNGYLASGGGTTLREVLDDGLHTALAQWDEISKHLKEIQSESPFPS